MGSSVFRVPLATTVPSSGSVCEGSRGSGRTVGTDSPTGRPGQTRVGAGAAARLSLHEMCSSVSVPSFLSRLAAPYGQGLAEDRKVLE